MKTTYPLPSPLESAILTPHLGFRKISHKKLAHMKPNGTPPRTPTHRTDHQHNSNNRWTRRRDSYLKHQDHNTARRERPQPHGEEAEDKGGNGVNIQYMKITNSALLCIIKKIQFLHQILVCTYQRHVYIT